MIVCKGCGHHNAEKDTFCGQCGAFLEWTGERVQPPPPPAQDEEEETAPKRGFLARVHSALYADVGNRPPVEPTPRPGTASAARPGTTPAARPAAPATPPRPGAPATPPRPGAPATPPRPGAPAPPKPGAPPRPPGSPPAPPKPPPPKPPPPAGGPPKPPSPPAAPPKPPAAPPKPPAAPGAAPPAPPKPPAAPPMPPKPPAPAPPKSPLPAVDNLVEKAPAVENESTRVPALPPPPPPPPAPPAPPPPAPELPKTQDKDAAKKLIVPVAGAGQGARGELPQEVKAAAPAIKKRPPTNKLKPGDLVCGECGEGNAPTRKFCSRCGTSLADAVVVRTPWWRRLLPKGGAKVRKSGDRPKGTRQGKSKVAEKAGALFQATRRVLAVLLLIAGIAYGVSGQFRGWVNERALAAKQWAEELVLPQYDPVSPVSVKATVELPDRPGKAAVDGNTASFWAAPGNSKPILVLTYDRPVDLERAIVRTGAQSGFQGMHRPRKLHLVFSTGKTADVELKDQPDPQEVSFDNGEGATSVQIHVVEVIKSLDGDELALTEIEMFVRR